MYTVCKRPRPTRRRAGPAVWRQISVDRRHATATGGCRLLRLAGPPGARPTGWNAFGQRLPCANSTGLAARRLRPVADRRLPHLAVRCATQSWRSVRSAEERLKQRLSVCGVAGVGTQAACTALRLGILNCPMCSGAIARWVSRSEFTCHHCRRARLGSNVRPHVIDDPILRAVSQELRTSRLVLRCPREGDGQAVHEAVVETLEQLRAWPASLPWATLEPSAAASETYCRESAAAFIKRTALVYLAFDASGALVASTSLHSINWAVPRFEVGFWCRASRQRQGLTAESVSELVRYAFEGLGASRVDAFPDEANAPSRAVCEAAGMQLEGIMRSERVTPEGILRNTCVYAAVRSEA